MNFARLLSVLKKGHQLNICKYHQRFCSVQASFAQSTTSEKYFPGDEIHGYTVQKVQEIPELYLTAIQLQHIKTGAQHLHIDRKDNNNVFSVSFRTTPMDDTGVPHILEHTALCGSQKYPVRDPFFKMLNRSLATFMNAFTSSDWTAYPFSSQNKQDFQNLMSVYLDAVFHPQLRELDFCQEGWRLEHAEVEDEFSPLIFKGVVYNEMKGVFSNSRNLYCQVAQNKLLPSHTYGVNYGGDPASIPQLTWEQLKQFHASHYHPSNSRFYTYGSFPLEDHLKFINENYLQNFSLLHTDTKVPPEKRWSHPRHEQISCQPDPMAPDKDKQTTVSVNYLLSPVTDSFEAFTQKIIGTLLVEGEMAPFYQSLIESQIGADYSPVNGYSGDTFEGTFSVGLEGIHPNDVEKVQQLIDQTFDKVIKDGFDEKRIEAILHKIELSLKHQSSNFGLGLSLTIATSWNHDGDPVRTLQINNHVTEFRERLQQDPQFLQKKVEQYFKNNKHKLTLVMSPDENFEVKRQEEEQKCLDDIISTVKESEKEEIFKRGKELLSKQMAKEDLSCLPTLKVDSIDKKINKEPFETINHDGVNIQYSEQPTNEVSYLRMVTDADQIPNELQPYLPLFTEVITSMGAGDLDYKKQSQEIDLCSGGLDAGVHVSIHKNNIDTFEQGILFSSYCLDRNFQKMLDLWTEIFNRPLLQDQERLTTLIRMVAASMAGRIADIGHNFAMSHSASSLNPASHLLELYSGMTQVSILKKLAESPDLSKTIECLQDISRIVLNKENLRLCVNSTPDAMSKSLKMVESFINTLPGKSIDKEFYKKGALPKAEEHNTQFELPFSVNYVSSSLSTVPYSHQDYARLRVLSRLMSTKYLHREIREKGGAYGGGASCQPGVFSFYSYRDPKNIETIKVFQDCVSWATSGSFTNDDIDEAKLGVFQQIDKPVTPGSIGVTHFLTGINDDVRQQARDQLFSVNHRDLTDVAERYLTSETRPVSFLGPRNDAIATSSSWKIIKE